MLDVNVHAPRFARSLPAGIGEFHETGFGFTRGRSQRLAQHPRVAETPQQLCGALPMATGGSASTLSPVTTRNRENKESP